MKKYLNIILLILWMVFLFIMSNAPAEESSNQSGLIVGHINKILNFENIKILTTIIRKLAHLFEYVILGILMINCLKDYKINKCVLIAFILCFIYASTDEIHQMFIPGRNGNIIDIMIDSIGSVIGIFIYKIIKFKSCKKKILMVK